MKFIFTICTVIIVGFVFANNKKPQQYSKEDYISMWKDVAIENQKDYRIPASITLAQGILESGYGNSELAKKANNHFGIKCHNWTGKSFYMDDDQKDECFRKYENASQSYSDHSLFLTTRSRYSSLFDLEITDYKSWAFGLKKAGYATNPKYPNLLIKIIEDNNLNKYDQQFENKKEEELVFQDSDIQIIINKNLKKIQTHQNNIKFIYAQKGDTYYKIAKANQMNLMQLYNYNDYSSKKEVLDEGDIVFLQPKREKSRSNKKFIITKQNISLRLFSQKEGIKLKNIIKMNPNIQNIDEKIAVGTKIKIK